MNHIHRSAWCPRRGTHIAVAETSRGRSKQSGSAAVAGALLGAVLMGHGLSALAAGSPPPGTLPGGEQVVAGAVQVVRSGNVMTVTQGSARAVIDWQDFSVGSTARVNFVQPSAQAAVLNRVLGADVSVIQGRISANGQVFLTNPNGVLFSPTAQVDVGALVASTHTLSTADFMAGHLRLSGSSTASVENQGQISAAAGGVVALVAARVVNQGSIRADAGRIGLAAASTVTLDLGGPVLLNVSEGALQAEVDQGGALRADGGQIWLTARAAGNLAASVINHRGVSQAQTLADVTGSLHLQADLVSHTGVLDARGLAAGQAGGHIGTQAQLLVDAGSSLADGVRQGGHITQQANDLQQTRAAQLSASSAQGQGGVVRLLGGSASGGSAWLSGSVSATGVQGGRVDASAHRLVAAGLQVDTSGSQAAGRVRLGGGWQGQASDLANATTTTVSVQTTLTNQGVGGQVVVWSDEQTRYAGHIQATGSAAEVSGADSLLFAGTAHTASLLLDPRNITIAPVSSGLNVLTIDNPNAVTGDGFGGGVTELPNGNLVIQSSGADVGGVSNVGRVYLYQPDGTLLSTLSGSTALDGIGNLPVVVLASGNYLLRSPNWDNGVATNAGAITWGSATAGVSGVVGAANSLVGGTANDSVGSGTYPIIQLSSGNYLVRSPLWDNGSVVNAGAVTWGSGSAGVSGAIGPANSLVATNTAQLGGTATVSPDIFLLSNGNYLVRASGASNGSVVNAGAVTWGSGTLGVRGSIDPSNSLMGGSVGDAIGSYGVVLLPNGNYLVRSALWDNGGVANAGAVTWGDGTTGVVGLVSASNSLVGSTADDQLGITSGGASVTVLSNGNYVVNNPWWDNGGLSNVGAVTWGSGATGISGVVSASNSLVGSVALDAVGTSVTALSNGNYVVRSTGWDRGSVIDAGAVTWGNGNGGTVGAVSASNSLVGSTASDKVGSIGVTALTNGNYVVSSHQWRNGSSATVGAVTWGNGNGGTVGPVSASNSLVGALGGDALGNGSVTALSNGNYLLYIPALRKTTGGAPFEVGGVSWGNGNGGTVGVVSSTNTLMGNMSGDAVGSGGITVLANDNYLVLSPAWSNGGVAGAGAVTWGNGTTGTAGVVSTSNSLVGSTASDGVGTAGSVTALSNGNYLVSSPLWDNGAVVDAGAVTWGSGTAGVSGAISASNSLVGSTAGDRVGSAGTVTKLSNGNYLVSSPLWDNGAVVDVGAVTWGSGTVGVSGAVSASNSLVGSTASDGVGAAGSVTALSNGNYLVSSPLWDNGAVVDAGAVTWGSGTVGVSGAISASNSLVGSTASDGVGTASSVTALSNGNYVVRSFVWDNGSLADAGAVTWGSGTVGVSGAISASNSLVGSTASDGVGNAGVTALSNGNYLVRSSLWDNGSLANAGAVTLGNGSTGTAGPVTSMNSVLGTAAVNQIGTDAPVALSSGSVLVRDLGGGVGGRVFITDGSTTVGASDPVASASFGNNAGASSTITPTDLLALLNAGTAVTLQANNDITLASALTVNNGSGNGGALSLQAGRSINLNAALVTDNGDFTAIAGSASANPAHTDAGNPTITLGSGGSINAGSGTVNLVALGANGRFVNSASAGGNAISAATTNLYLPSWNTGTTYASLGGLVATARRYNTSWNEGTASGACATLGCTLPGTGLNLLYAAAPVLSVVPTTGQTSNYGAAFTASGETLSGFVNGDTSSTAGISGTALYSVGGSVSGSGFAIAGVHDLVYSGGLLSSLGYGFADASGQGGELTVAQASIGAITGITAGNRTYDGTTTATLNTGGAGFSGLVSGDVLTVATAQGAFVDASPGSGKTVHVTGLSLGGADAGNYTLASTVASTTANVLAVGGGAPSLTRPGSGTNNATLAANVHVATLLAPRVLETGAAFWGVRVRNELVLGSGTERPEDRPVPEAQVSLQTPLPTEAAASRTAGAPSLQTGGVRFVSGAVDSGRDPAGYVQVGVIGTGIALPTIVQP